MHFAAKENAGMESAMYRNVYRISQIHLRPSLDLAYGVVDSVDE
jgi:hypothetical protein